MCKHNSTIIGINSSRVLGFLNPNSGKPTVEGNPEKRNRGSLKYKELNNPRQLSSIRINR